MDDHVQTAFLHRFATYDLEQLKPSRSAGDERDEFSSERTQLSVNQKVRLTFVPPPPFLLSHTSPFIPIKIRCKIMLSKEQFKNLLPHKR